MDYEIEHRLSLEETWRRLESEGLEMPRDSNGKPFIPNETPNFDDDELGFSMFKEGYENCKFSDSTLPRSFVCRSRLSMVDFGNTDLQNQVFVGTTF